MALDQKNKGLGPTTPSRPVQPIKSLQSSAPKTPGGLNPQGLRPVAQIRPISPLMGAQPQQAQIDPDEVKLDQLRAIPPNAADIPSAPFDRPIFDTPKSFEGWLKNLGDDIGSFVEGLPAMVKVAWESGSYISKNLDGVKMLYDHPEYLTKELDSLKTALVKGVTDTYKDGIGEALYKHPFTVLMDATTIFDLVGGGLKMAGKAALTAAEKQAIKAGAELGGSMASKLIKLGDNVQRTPGRIFAAPLKGAGKLAMKVPQIRTVAEKLALTPYGISRKDKLASMMMESRVQAAQSTEDLFKKSIPKADWDEYWDLAIGFKPMGQASKPNLADHARRWREANGFNEEWMKAMGIKTQAELDTAALKPLVEKLHSQGLLGEIEPWKIEKGNVVFNQEALDFARDWVKTQGTEPSYMPYFLDRDSTLLDVLESTKSQGQNLRTVKRFEKKGLADGIMRNPQEIQARATLQTAELRGVVRYIEDTIQTSGKIVKGDALPAGHKYMDPVLLKYVQDGLIPVHEAMVSKYADELARGMTPEQALRNTVKHVDDTMGDALIAKAKEAADDSKNWSIAIPTEDAYLIESQLRGVAGPLRFYDKLMNTWRSTVLRLMPRYYMNNLLGNSILMLVGGHTPFTATVLDPKLLPGEAVSSAGLLNEAGYAQDFLSRLPGMGPQGIVTKITDKASAITDAMPRGLLMNTTMKEQLKRQGELGGVAANALLSMGSMDDAVKAAFAARKEVMNLTEKQAIMTKRVNLQVQEKAALSKIDGEMKELQAQIDRERALSNATPVKDQILEKIGQNASADEIHALHKRVELAGPSTSRLEELQAQLQKKFDQRERLVGDYPFERSEGGLSQDVNDLIQASARRQALAPVAKLVDNAVGDMEKFLGNYGRLHPLEREWVRRAIPFWTFAKTMNQLIFQMPFIAPKRSFLWNHYAKFMIDAANDDRLPHRYRNHIPIGGTEDGQIILMKANGFNPFEAVEMTEMGGIRIPKLVDPASNPFVKIGIETRGGYDVFTEKPFTQPTDYVSLDGTVWSLNPATNVLKVKIPQKPLVASLLSQIPHVKIVQEALDGFAATRGVAGVSRRDPEGNYYYDRSPMWAASRALGFPITVADPERVKLQHSLLIKGMIKRFSSAANRVDPDQRAKLMHILNDLANGGFELREW